MLNDSFFSRVITLQFNVKPGAPADNIAEVRALLDQSEAAAGSLVVLPELWATGFDYPRCIELAQQTPALLLELQKIAVASGLMIAGSMLELPEGERKEKKPWNTFFIVDAKGVVGKYRKQHLFGFWNEDRFFTAGDRPEPIATAHGVVGPLVCYDLRFPALARGHAFAGADILVVSAQWPKSRLDHWQILLQARAVENQAFVVGCNSCGLGGKIEFGGHSMVIGPDGRILAEAGEENEVVSCELPTGAVRDLRRRFCTVAERPWPGHDRDKICSLNELLVKIQQIRNQGSRVAFTNGCFDLLHSGHVSYLEHARRTADLLIIGLNSDASVRRLKGESRPVNSEQDRARVLAALGCVDFVTMFDEDTPHDLITSILPDVLVKGADWGEDEIVGAVEVKAAGGRVERVVFEHQCSTTALIEKIRY